MDSVFPYYRFYQIILTVRAARLSVQYISPNVSVGINFMCSGETDGGIAHGRMHHKQLLIGPSNKTRREVVEYSHELSS